MTQPKPDAGVEPEPIWARRDDGSLHVHLPNLPGFHFILQPGEVVETALLPTLNEFLPLYLKHAASARQDGYNAAIKMLRKNARDADYWSGLPKTPMTESEWSRCAADYLSSHRPEPSKDAEPTELVSVLEAICEAYESDDWPVSAAKHIVEARVILARTKIAKEI